MTTQRPTRRTTRRVAAVLTAVALATGGVLAVGGAGLQLSPSATETASPSLSALEMEAQDHLLQARRERAAQLTRRDALARTPQAASPCSAP